VLGCDFSSSPSPRKPIVMAWGQLAQNVVRLTRIDTHLSLDRWQAALQSPGPWVGGFDLPFGLPRELIEHLGWPTHWEACMDHYAGLSREAIRDTFRAFCDARPAGHKFAHRATDGPAGSSPSMKWVNPPVAFMLHAGVPALRAAGVHLPALRAAGVHLPGLSAGDPSRVALEAYPGWLAREVLGRQSYKSDDKAKQTPERLLARKQVLHALDLGQTRLGLRLRLTPAQHDDLVADASGDRLDAVLCLMQAAWALRQHQSGHPNYGLPKMDALEGWIVGV